MFSVRAPPETGIETLEQLEYVLVIAAHEGNANLLADGGQRCAADRWDLCNGLLTASTVEASTLIRLRRPCWKSLVGADGFIT
jgi:hypothetical protein